MKFQDLPLHLAQEIVKNLQVEDVFQLSYTSRKLRLVYTHESIWKQLQEISWGRTSKGYGLENSKTLSFEQAVEYYKRQLKIMHLIERYTPEGDYNFTVLLDEIIDDFDNIPVLVRIYQNIQYSIEQSMKGNGVIDISKYSLIINLILALNFKLGYQFLDRVGIETSLEELCVKFDIFQKPFHHLIQNRQIKFDLIDKLLYQKVYIKTLKYQSNLKITLVGQNINFHSERTYVRFVSQIAKIILSTFSCKLDIDNLEEYFDNFYLEDYSILHVYSNISKGHPLILMSIIIDQLTRFLSPFTIYINDEPVSLDIILTKNFIQVKNCYLFLNPLNHPKQPFEIEMYSEREVRNLLRFDFGYNDAKIKTYLSPVGYEYFMESFITLNVPSVSSISPTNQSINYQDYQFIKFIFKFIKYQPLGNYQDFVYCSEFFKYLSKLNYFIYLKSIYATIDKAKESMLLNYSQPQEAMNHFKYPDFTLTSKDCTLFFNIVRKSIFNSRHIVQSSAFPAGSVVQHARFKRFGIVLGSFEMEDGDSKYIFVYTTNDSVEIYDTNSISPAPTNPKVKLAQLQHVYNSCSLDTLGLLFCHGIDMDNYKFIAYT